MLTGKFLFSAKDRSGQAVPPTTKSLRASVLPVSPIISVIIPVYRDWSKLSACLTALSRQTLATDRFEILIVNNEPDAMTWDGSLPVNARLLHEPKPGSYSARNSAVAVAAGRYLAFTDADCLPDPEWLAAGLARLSAEPAARVTGPVTIYREADTSYFPYLYEFHTSFRQKESAAKGVCVTANLLVSKEVFLRVGWFDDALLSGGDYEWNRRAQVQGFPLMLDEAVKVRHPARASVREIVRKQRRTAGSGLWARRISIAGLLWRTIKPPIRELRSFDRAPIRRRDRLPLIGLMWLAKAAHNLEIVRIRLGLGKPRRS